MGICTSNKKSKRVVKGKNPPIAKQKTKVDEYNNNGVIITSRTTNVKTLEKVMGKINKDELKKFNTNISHNSNKTCPDVNLTKKKDNYNHQSSLQNLDAYEIMNTENIPLSFTKQEKNIFNDNKIIKTGISDKKTEKESNNNYNINFIKSKEDNTIDNLNIDN